MDNLNLAKAIWNNVNFNLNGARKLKAQLIDGCGETFHHGVGEFICNGRFYIGDKKQFCPKCEKIFKLLNAILGLDEEGDVK